MATTISKGKMFSVVSAIPDAFLAALKAAPDIAEKALGAAADYWHTGILPKHFEIGASQKYDYAPRGPKYLKDRKKRGKPPLVYSGSLRHDLKARAAIKTTGKTGVELKMFARVLNFARTLENSPDKYVKHKNGVGYPNLKREIKAVTDEEREQIANVIQDQIVDAFDSGDTRVAAAFSNAGLSI